jgi:hypothetical protein
VDLISRCVLVFRAESGGGGRCPFGGDRGLSFGSDSEMGFSDFGSDDGEDE